MKYGNVFVLLLWVIVAGGMAMVMRNIWLFRKLADAPEEDPASPAATTTKSARGKKETKKYFGA